jgi:hypothetical protein
MVAVLHGVLAGLRQMLGAWMVCLGNSPPPVTIQLIRHSPLATSMQLDMLPPQQQQVVVVVVGCRAPHQAAWVGDLLRMRMMVPACTAWASRAA